MKIMVGIDLHSNNALCGLMDESGRRLAHKKLPCDLALNVFWLPAGREEGVRRAWTKVRAGQSDPSPGSDATRWNQMGD